MLNFLYYLRVKEYNDDGGVRRNKVHCVVFLRKKKKKKEDTHTGEIRRCAEHA